MTYQLQAVTIRANNTKTGMKQIAELWADVTTGKLPVLFDSAMTYVEEISPISRYSNYSSDESGDYDMSIIGVKSDFFEEMEQAAAAGKYKKYEAAADDIAACTRAAWEKVWQEQENGTVQRIYTKDYESTVPAAYSADGKCHCHLYIAIAES